MASKLILVTLIIVVFSDESITIITYDMSKNILHTIINVENSRFPDTIHFNGEKISEYYENISDTYYKKDGNYLKILPKETYYENTIKLTYSYGIYSFENMFKSCSDFIKSIYFTDFDMSSTRNMKSMFESCTSLKKIYDLSPNNVIYMDNAFRGCTSLNFISFKYNGYYDQIEYMENLFED